MVIDIFPKEAWFMIAIAFIWIIVAIVMDFKKREVENWWNFSLIAFVSNFIVYILFVVLNTCLGSVLGCVRS